MKIFSPSPATMKNLLVEVKHSREESEAKRWHWKTGGVVSGDLWKWGSFGESVWRWQIRVWKGKVNKLFSGKFQGFECIFSSHCSFSSKDYYPPLVPAWPYPLWEAHCAFFQHLLPREKSRERPKAAAGRGCPLPGRRQWGQEVLGGPTCPWWGRATCGKVPADLQPFLEQQTLQALLMQGL